MDDIKKEVERILHDNRQKSDEHEYTCPSPESYPYQWLWDSCYHAIILTHIDIEYAKKELTAVASRQFDNGLIPHIIYWQKNEVLNVDWGKKGTSSITQPPIIAYAVWRIYSRDGDRAFLRAIYPALYRYYQYLLTRDVAERHVVGLINPDESGEDNSPRFDAALGLPPQHTTEENNAKRFALIERNRECGFEVNECMRNFFWVKDVSFNAYLVENLEVMSALADALEKDEDGRYFAEHAGLIRSGMREHMLEDGILWSTHGEEEHKIRVRTWGMFAPLIANVYSREEADNLVKRHLLDSTTFWATYPIPTTAMDEESFNPKEEKGTPIWLHPNWRGPVWIAANWHVYRGLMRYGFTDEAERIKKASVELLRGSGFREYFHPMEGTGMGAHDFTWGGLVLDMAEEYAMPPDRKAGQKI